MHMQFAFSDFKDQSGEYRMALFTHARSSVYPYPDPSDCMCDMFLVPTSFVSAWGFAHEGAFYFR